MDFLLQTILSGLLWDNIKKSFYEFKSELMRSFLPFDSHEDEKSFDHLIETISNNKESFQNATEIETFIENDSALINAANKLQFRTAFSKRIQYVVSMINQTLQPSILLNYENLGYMLGHPSCEQMRTLFYGDIEPTYEIEDKLSELLGVSKEWMRSQNGSCFEIITPGYDIKQIQRAIYDEHPEELILVCSSENPSMLYGALFLILRKTEYCYKCIDISSKILSANVGVSGLNELALLFDSLYKIQQENEIHVNSTLYHIDYDLGLKIKNNLHPCIALNNKHVYKTFIDDFFDCIIDPTQEDYYEGKYDTAFTSIANRIRYNLKPAFSET